LSLSPSSRLPNPPRLQFYPSPHRLQLSPNLLLNPNLLPKLLMRRFLKELYLVPPKKRS
jgi:hypothetical protein